MLSNKYFEVVGFGWRGCRPCFDQPRRIRQDMFERWESLVNLGDHFTKDNTGHVNVFLHESVVDRIIRSN